MTDLTINCIVKNEEKWVWYALGSIRKIANQVLIYDTGSTDQTPQIIKSFNDQKFIFEEKGPVNAAGLTKLRKEQLKRTKTKWLMILDGDEIWPQKTLGELEEALKKAKEQYAVVVRAYNAVGDVYHFHPESIHHRWPYAPKNYLGWANLRVVRTTIPGLHIEGDYPFEAYMDKNEIPLQNYGPGKLVFLNNRYFHTSYLLRSNSRKQDKGILNRAKKWKIEAGVKFPKSFRYPEVFYQKHPAIVADPWARRNPFEHSIAKAVTPIKEVRRRFLGLYRPHGN